MTIEVGALLSAAVRLTGGRRRLVSSVWNLLRLPVSRVWDPDIPYRVGSRTLRIPLSHDLPVIHVISPEYGQPLKLVVEAAAPGAMVDVGANVGDTAVLMLDHGATRVLAVEPSERYRRLLVRNVPEAVAVDALLGCSGHARLVEQRGTGRTVSGEGVGVRRLSEVLPPEFSSPSLVKLDTDGMDQSILLADLEWLREARPVLFVEYSPDLTSDGAYGFFSVMREAGFGFLLWYDEQGRYLASTTPGDERIVNDLAHHFRGGGNRHYADVAMFADEARWASLRARSVRGARGDRSP